MRSSRVPRLTAILVAVMLSLTAAVATAAPGRQIHDRTESPAAGASTDVVLVTLTDAAVASYAGGSQGYDATKPAHGHKLDTASKAVQRYEAKLRAAHDRYAAWLARKAPKAEVLAGHTLTTNTVAVRLNGTDAAVVANGPGVKTTASSWGYRPSMNASVDLIGAPALWASSSRADAGSGIKVGVIDTGIDDSHDFFSCKTITHKVYASGVANPAGAPLRVFDHGTHVAGTIGGCVIDITGPVTGTISGVAPGVDLYDYNVFPGYGGGYVAFGGSAFSHDIIAAVEDAVRDGMDVINLSLGGAIQGPHDTLAEAIDGAAAAGVVAAIAAGNSGPGDSTVESPGSAPGAITVAASTNSHLIALPVFTSDFAEPFVGVTGDFDGYEATTVSGAPLVDSASNACAGLPAAAVTAAVVLIDRGACSFTTKVRAAQTAGYAGVVVVNNVGGPATAMGHDGSDPFPTIPAAMVSLADGTEIRGALSAATTTSIAGPATEIGTPDSADVLAGFSSRGPTRFTYLVKPDVTAPGVNIWSSVFGNEFAAFQGTSMAAPHVAGGAALLLAAHDDWGPLEVKSAIVNSAARVVTASDGGGSDPGALARGGGRLDLPSSDSSAWFADPVSVSFGLVNGNRPADRSVDVALWSVSGPGTCTAVLDGDGGGLASVTVDGGTLHASFAGGRGVGSGDLAGDIVVTCDGDELRVPWFVRVDRKGRG